LSYWNVDANSWEIASGDYGYMWGPRRGISVSRAVYMFTQLRRKRYDDISGIDAGQ